jgi:hypothetical protein
MYIPWFPGSTRPSVYLLSTSKTNIVNRFSNSILFTLVIRHFKILTPFLSISCQCPMEHCQYSCQRPMEHCQHNCQRPMEHCQHNCQRPMEHCQHNCQRPMEHCQHNCQRPMEHCQHNPSIRSHITTIMSHIRL